jgi:site-specific recombinase XerD
MAFRRVGQIVARIDTVEARSKLKPRRTPYWRKLSTGYHLGFRKMTAASTGTWIAQAYDPATQKQTRKSLGPFSTLPAHERFDAAKKEGEAWFQHLGRGGSTEIVTVRKACEHYVDHVRDGKGEDKANDIEARFKRWVYEEKLASFELQKLTRKHVEDWRRNLTQTPVMINRGAKKPSIRERAPSSVNRDMSALRAALNYAYDNGHVTTDMAWRVALRPIKNADGRRDVYLDIQQRRKLLNNAQADVSAFLRGLSLVPLRPGALAHLSVANFDKRLRVLTIGKDKTGRDRKIKLPDKTAQFFAEQAKGKLPAAPLLSRATGQPWDKDAWKWPVKAAAVAAELPEDTTAYTLRHSVITDLVTGGLDLLTVAQLSGTSVVMIERHYGHLRAHHAAQALAGLGL